MAKNKGEEFLPQSRIALAKVEEGRKNRRLMYPLCALFASYVLCQGNSQLFSKFFLPLPTPGPLLQSGLAR
jgi:hypothetical protein